MDQREAKNTGGSSIGQQQHHQFESWTYTCPTNCDQCEFVKCDQAYLTKEKIKGGKLLWGLTKQGLHCITCSRNIHFDCARSLEATTNQCNPSIPNHLNSRNQEQTPIQIPSHTQPLTPNSTSTTLLEEFVTQTTISKLENERAKAAANPPLDLAFTTPRNMAAFVPRITAIVAAFEFTQDILAWKNQAASLLAFLGLNKAIKQ
ncbi:hypothetical protein HK100_003830 [Physocladia obscura]|uniref:Phorbol-ester/DAG-type domain-containing protein n=1 Tax=Physocladia obscura TaxID=109957 RepID=A0AAD5SZL2_9FUNG|nr:hypothetical protein HK100_003830 [Physocladia obscura]